MYRSDIVFPPTEPSIETGSYVKGNGSVVTVIIPVFNSPWFTEKAIRSAVTCRNRTIFKIKICDDGSDDFTRNLIERIARGSDHVTIQRQEHNIGFIQTVNQALSSCTTPYAAIVNSDVILTDHWLDRLLAVAESDPRIATVNPLTNCASQIEVPLPPGVNFFEADHYLEKHFHGACDVVTGVGFCMLIRMAALRQVGFLDEVYGTGYCEESDLCMRLTTNGWRTVVAPGSFIYHKGSGTFTNKHERYLHNRRIFDERWATQYESQFKSFRKADPLGAMRKDFASPTRWAPYTHARQVYRNARAAIRSRQWQRVAKVVAKGILTLPAARESMVDSRHIAKFKQPSAFSVTYVLPLITLAGGVISVLQIVNELILLGVDARIATLHIHSEMQEWPQYSGWMRFRNYAEMIERLPATDIIVATHWTTVDAVQSLHKKGRAKHAVYFVQDYEPWFFPEEDRRNRLNVENTYRMVPEKIVKSNWLVDMLTPFKGTIHKIPLGMDLQIFYPRNGNNHCDNKGPVIVAMARPKTPRRGFGTLVDGLSLIKKHYPHVRIRFFGEDLSRYPIPFAYEGLGIVVRRNDLAKLYSDADIFIDASDFQGFGRPALEAMACETACVLTSFGGVREYARDGVNALLIPPKDPKALFNAAQRLLNDGELRQKLAAGGKETVTQYCHKREAHQTAQLFQRIVGQSDLINPNVATVRVNS